MQTFKASEYTAFEQSNSRVNLVEICPSESKMYLTLLPITLLLLLFLPFALVLKDEKGMNTKPFRIQLSYIYLQYFCHHH